MDRPLIRRLVLKVGEQFERLIEILAKLRGPGGCPWDQEQTFQDINPYLLEEAHEVLESIDTKDFAGLKEELGDLLVHIFFYSQLAKEENKFGAEDVAQSACEKLIRRHPHVFGDKKVASTEEVLANWEKIKQTEKKKESILEGLPKTLPALVKAFRLGEKSSRVGLDWSNTQGILKKVEEEIQELMEAMTPSPSPLPQGEREKVSPPQAAGNHQVEKEYGDLLFTLANLGRFLKLDPETALRKACHNFIQRFQWIEKKARQDNQPLQSLSAQQWDALWEEAKNSTS